MDNKDIKWAIDNEDIAVLSDSVLKISDKGNITVSAVFNGNTISREYRIISKEDYKVVKPEKTTYLKDENLYLKGCCLLEGDESISVDRNMISGFDSSKPGISTVSINYNNVIFAD